jgi:hypothetical protein
MFHIAHLTSGRFARLMTSRGASIHATEKTLMKILRHKMNQESGLIHPLTAIPEVASHGIIISCENMNRRKVIK